MFCLKPIWTNTKVDHPSPYIYIFYLKVVCHQILFSEFGVGMINICIVLKLTPGSLVGVNPDFPPLRAKSGV